MKETALKEHVRLTILRLLNEMPSGFCNASLMTDGLRDMCLDVNRAFVVREFRWLEGQGLVTLREHEQFDIIGATITDTGAEVATRQRIVKGVRPPRRSSLPENPA